MNINGFNYMMFSTSYNFVDNSSWTYDPFNQPILDGASFNIKLKKVLTLDTEGRTTFNNPILISETRNALASISNIREDFNIDDDDDWLFAIRNHKPIRTLFNNTLVTTSNLGNQICFTENKPVIFSGNDIYKLISKNYRLFNATIPVFIEVVGYNVHKYLPPHSIISPHNLLFAYQKEVIKKYTKVSDLLSKYNLFVKNYE